MALKGNRVLIETDITLTCNTVTQRGVTLSYTSNGSGVVLGDSAGTADPVANPSGYKPAGILLGDFVNIDLTRYHLNFQKDESQIGMRATVVRKGRLTTDQVINASSISGPGADAYLTSSGTLTPILHATGGLAATPKVGTFQGFADESGFVTVDVMLPQT